MNWPMELLDYLVAGANLLIGVGVGKRLRPRPAPPLKPVCTCDHGFGTHDGGQQCNGKVEEAARYDSYGVARAWQMVSCTCLRYDGPDPAIFGLEVR